MRVSESENLESERQYCTSTFPSDNAPRRPTPIRQHPHRRLVVHRPPQLLPLNITDARQAVRIHHEDLVSRRGDALDRRLGSRQDEKKLRREQRDESNGRVGRDEGNRVGEASVVGGLEVDDLRDGGGEEAPLADEVPVAEERSALSKGEEEIDALELPGRS